MPKFALENELNPYFKKREEDRKKREIEEQQAVYNRNLGLGYREETPNYGGGFPQMFSDISTGFKKNVSDPFGRFLASKPVNVPEEPHQTASSTPVYSTSKDKLTQLLGDNPDTSKYIKPPLSTPAMNKGVLSGMAGMGTGIGKGKGLLSALTGMATGIGKDKGLLSALTGMGTGFKSAMDKGGKGILSALREFGQQQANPQTAPTPTASGGGILKKMRELQLEKPDYPEYQGDKRMSAGLLEMMRQNRLENQQYNREWGDLSPIEKWKKAWMGDVPDYVPERESQLYAKTVPMSAGYGENVDKMNALERAGYRENLGNAMLKDQEMQYNKDYKTDQAKAERDWRTTQAQSQTDALRYKAGLEADEKKWDRLAEIFANRDAYKNQIAQSLITESREKGKTPIDTMTALNQAEDILQKQFDPQYDGFVKSMFPQ